MARPDAGKVGLVGAGRQARAQILALHAIGRAKEVAVFARNRDQREAFCERLAVELGVPVRAAATAKEAVKGADIVVTATNSSTAVLMSEWLAPGAHVNAMGANAANRRELDPQIVMRAATVATDDVEQAKTEAAEFIDLAKKDPIEALRKWFTVEALVKEELGKAKPESAGEANGQAPRGADGKFVSEKPPPTLPRKISQAPAPAPEPGGRSSAPVDEAQRAADAAAKGDQNAVRRYIEAKNREFFAKRRTG